MRRAPTGLAAGGEPQIHAAAVHDRALLAAGEQSARAMLAQVLGAAGVKKVTVDFT